MLRLNEAANCYEVATGIPRLCGEDEMNILEHLRELYEMLGDEIISDPPPPDMTPTVNPGELIMVAHIAWLTGRRELGEECVRLASRADLPKCVSKFSIEYVRAMLSLIEKTPYEPRLSKLDGFEKQLATYLTLISDVTHTCDTAAAVAGIVESFKKANQDKRRSFLSIVPEPTGKEPLKWDFRLESLRWYAGEVYGVEI